MNESESERQPPKSALDRMLEQSSLELGKLAAIYRRHGFTEEANQVSETAKRMQMKDAEPGKNKASSRENFQKDPR